MFPGPTQLLLLDFSTELIWAPKSKSNTLTPKNISKTYWSREILHVMNGIIFCVCSTLAISVLPIVLKWCRKERRKSNTSEPVDRAVGKNEETCNARLFLKLLRMKYWRKWFSQEWKSDEVLETRTERLKWTIIMFVHSAHRQIRHWWRWYER